MSVETRIERYDLAGRSSNEVAVWIGKWKRARRFGWRITLLCEDVPASGERRRTTRALVALACRERIRP